MSVTHSKLSSQQWLLFFFIIYLVVHKIFCIFVETLKHTPMGQLVYIKLKDGVNPEQANTYLQDNGLNDFTTEQDNIDWLEDINTKPNSPQAHLKPADRDLTMEELKKTFPRWTESNLLSFDVAFSRTSQREIDGYCEMIHDNVDDIEYIDGADDIIERYTVALEMKPILGKLNKPEEVPELLPKEEQNQPNLEGGLFLCKSFSIKPFWVIFGRVNRPKFLKEKIYKDDLYNKIYHDKQGYAYLMFPLLKLDGKEMDAVTKSYMHAWGIGLREDFSLLIPLIYHFGIADHDNVARDYMETYTEPDELLNKFKQVFKYITSTYEYSSKYLTGFHYSVVHKKFRVNGANSVLEAQIGVLTALLRAIAKKHGYDVAANLLTEITNEKFIPTEVK